MGKPSKRPLRDLISFKPIDAVQIGLFVAALMALFSLVVAVWLGAEDWSLAWGLAAGWIIGMFQAFNAMAIRMGRE
jgi:hypothetical protein